MAVPLDKAAILITGASSGIGAALARLVAQQVPTTRLILTARRIEQLNTIAEDCRAQGADVLVIPADLSDDRAVQNLVAQVLDWAGAVDILVNNAGYGQMGPLEFVPIEAAKQQLAVNLLGPLALTQALIPTMRQKGGGHIINISSIGGRIAFPLGGWYSASKFALECLSDVLRMELQPFNIQVSVVEPGPVKTPFFEVANTSTESLPDLQSTPYRAAFSAVEGLEQRLQQQAFSAERVARTIFTAMAANKPHPRYVVAKGGRLLLFLMTALLPRWAVDRFWQRFYGIDRVAEDWHQRQAAEATD